MARFRRQPAHARGDEPFVQDDGGPHQHVEPVPVEALRVLALALDRPHRLDRGVEPLLERCEIRLFGGRRAEGHDLGEDEQPLVAAALARFAEQGHDAVEARHLDALELEIRQTPQLVAPRLVDRQPQRFGERREVRALRRRNDRELDVDVGRYAGRPAVLRSKMRKRTCAARSDTVGFTVPRSIQIRSSASRRLVVGFDVFSRVGKVHRQVEDRCRQPAAEIRRRARRIETEHGAFQGVRRFERSNAVVPSARRSSVQEARDRCRRRSRRCGEGTWPCARRSTGRARRSPTCVGARLKSISRSA